MSGDMPQKHGFIMFYMMHSCGALPLKNGYRWLYIGLSFHNWDDN